MQNLNEGDSVAINGQPAKVIKVTKVGTVQLQVEDGSVVWAHRSCVQPRSFLTESDNG